MRAAILATSTLLLMSGRVSCSTTEPTIPVPTVSYPLPVADNIENNGNTLRYLMTDNPIIYILKGFNSVWQLGNSAWANGGANGNGPPETDYNTAVIVDETVWEQNIAYVEAVTHARTNAQAQRAYLDAMRDQNYAVLNGLGPLFADYVTDTGAFTTVFIDATTVENAHYAVVTEGGNGAGSTTSALGNVSGLVSLMRNWYASTSAPKYYFSSPRPWRMNSNGEVVRVGKETFACVNTAGASTNYVFDVYVSNVSVVPALTCQRTTSTASTSSIGKDGGYPSGHTNAAYLAAIGIAYAIPSRFSELLTRASDLGESRILSGFHSPLDVIGGRVQATAITAAALNEPGSNAVLKAAALADATEFFSAKLSAGQTLYEYAHTGDSSSFADHATNKALYRQRLTYGLSQDVSKAGQAPVVPEGAEVLLESRQPYLTENQRRAVLYTTSLDSGYVFLDESNGWGRLDLVAAADGYGVFLGDVTVDMDADDGGYSAHDWWRNDIKGAGGLVKTGTGMLTLTGANTYTGDTEVKKGTLEAASAEALGKGALTIQKPATLAVSSPSTLNVHDTLRVKGTLNVVVRANAVQISVASSVTLYSASVLTLDFSKVTPTSGSSYVIISSPQEIDGLFKFLNVVSTGLSVTLEYKGTSIVAKLR